MEEADPNIGRVIADRYRVSRYIFKDPYGLTYVGRDQSTRKQVLILFINPSLFGHSSNLFEQRSAAASRLRHPHIVPILYHQNNKEEGILVSSWARATPLSEALKDRVLLSCATAWCLQIATALQYAHQHNMVHGRLSPLSVRLIRQRTPPDSAQVSGWGLCHLRSTKDLSSHSSVTHADEAVWMSPECANGEPCTPASDIYSLGTILFHAVTGRPPYTGPTLKVLAAHAYEHAPAPSTFSSGIPMWIDNLVLRMLEKDPSLRPTTDEVIVALSSGRAQLSDGTAHPDHITANVAPVRLPQSDIRGTAASLPVVRLRQQTPTPPAPAARTIPILGILLLLGFALFTMYRLG